MAELDTLVNIYASAAYARLGMGLCKRYINQYVYKQEDNQTYPSTRLLHLDFSPDSLCNGEVDQKCEGKQGG